MPFMTTTKDGQRLFCWYIWSAALQLLSFHVGFAERIPSRCSSLDGPACSFLNGMDPAIHMQTEERMQPTILEGEFSSVFDRANDAPEKIFTSGSFVVQGVLEGATGELVLMPGEIVDMPRNWVTIGLKGRMTEDNFSGDVIDADGEKMEQCSGFSADMVEVTADSGGTSSVWKGHYVCHDFSTGMELRLASSINAPSYFRGVFQFSAEKRDDADLEGFEESDSITVIEFPQQTLAGCTCLRGWTHDGIVHRLGECTMSRGGGALPWCQIDERFICDSKPAGENWDVCHVTDTMVDVVGIVEELLDEMEMESVGNWQFIIILDGEQILIEVNMDDEIEVGKSERTPS